LPATRLHLVLPCYLPTRLLKHFRRTTLRLYPLVGSIVVLVTCCHDICRLYWLGISWPYKRFAGNAVGHSCGGRRHWRLPHRRWYAIMPAPRGIRPPALPQHPHLHYLPLPHAPSRHACGPNPRLPDNLPSLPFHILLGRPRAGQVAGGTCRSLCLGRLLPAFSDGRTWPQVEALRHVVAAG